jgi:uncharacterized tellurite resistance protein B-like protein
MKNLIILFGATIGAVTGGVAGLVIGAILGAIAAKFIFAGHNKPPHHLPGAVPRSRTLSAASVPSISVTISHLRKPQGAALLSGNSAKPVWNPPKSVVHIAGLRIDSGLIYTFEGRHAICEEPSAIGMSLPVADEAEHPANDLGYYADYSYITPAQRRTYLEWLAKGRTDEDPGCRALGYLFLFFYGLERRAFVDKDSQHEVLEATMTLLRTYAPAQKSRSLRSYFLQLAHFVAWEQGPGLYRSTWPELIALEEDRPREENLKFALANLFQMGEPLDWTMAIRVALVSEECRKSKVVTRVREQFWELFRKRFEERYPGGIELLAAKQPSIERYRTASAGLYYVRESATVSLPNVLGVHSQFSVIHEIWNSCIDDLSGYSRAVAGDRDDRQMKTWLALPEELRNPEAHPLRLKFEALLANSPREENLVFVQARSLSALLGLSLKAKLSIAQSRQVCEVVESLGYRVALDVRYTGIAYRSDQELALYQSDEAPATCFTGLLNLLFLTIVVAAADGFIEDEEIARFNALVDPEVPSSSTWLHLRAAEESLKRDGTVAVAALVQVAKKVPIDKQAFLFKTLLNIAAADGEIGLDELKALRRIARALSMKDDLVEELLREDAAFSEVTVERENPKPSAGEKIPPRPVAPSPFSLDHDRIKALTAETHEVISLLSSVMDENPLPTSVSPTPSATPSPSLPEWAGELDIRFHGAFMEMIQHETMTGEAFDALATKHHLMPDDLLNGVNFWSDEALGDFLLERDESVRIYLSLLPETLKAA